MSKINNVLRNFPFVLGFLMEISTKKLSCGETCSQVWILFSIICNFMYSKKEECCVFKIYQEKLKKSEPREEDLIDE